MLSTIDIDDRPTASTEAASAAERLAEAIRIETVSLGADAGVTPRCPFLALHDYLADAFPLTHRALRREIVNGRSLLYTWPGTDPALAPVLLLAHLDVVPVEPATRDAWTHPPFSGAIADGFVWGRGALDDKAAVLGLLEAVEGLLAGGFVPARTVYLAFGHDEEVGGTEGAARIAGVLRARGVRPAVSLDEGLAVGHGLLPGVRPPVAMVGIAEKGFAVLEVVARGTAGHASMPPARTALGALARAAHRIEARPMPARLTAPVRGLLESVGPAMPWLRRTLVAHMWLTAPLLTAGLARGELTRAAVRTTAALTVVSAGITHNVVPGEARAIVNLRILPGDTVASAVAHVRRVIADADVTIAVLQAVEPSPVAPADGPAFRLLGAAIRETFPDALVAPGLVVAGTDSKHYGSLVAAAYRFRPVRLGAADVARIHGIDERIAIAQHADAVRFYTRFIDLASQGGSS